MRWTSFGWSRVLTYPNTETDSLPARISANRTGPAVGWVGWFVGKSTMLFFFQFCFLIYSLLFHHLYSISLVYNVFHFFFNLMSKNIKKYYIYLIGILLSVGWSEFGVHDHLSTDLSALKNQNRQLNWQTKEPTNIGSVVNGSVFKISLLTTMI